MARDKFSTNTTVRVSVNRSPQPSDRPKPQSDDELRYGPFSRPEDDIPPSGVLQMVLIDSGMVFRDLDDERQVISQSVGGGPGDSDIDMPPGVMAYLQNGCAPGDNSGTNMNDLSESALENRWASRLRGVMFTRDDIKLPPFTGTTYRRVDRGMPLPADNQPNLDVLGLRIRIGSSPTTNVKLRDLPSAQSRLTGAENAAIPDPVLISALTHEVHESTFTGGSICRSDVDPQMWYTHIGSDQRSQWRDKGVFRPTVAIGPSTFSVECPVHFEPLDPYNTTDFKVTRKSNPDNTPATFNSTEVALPKLQVPSPRVVRLWLVPQLWRFSIQWNSLGGVHWTRGGGSPPFSYYVPWASELVTECHGYMPAFSSPYVVNGWETPANANSVRFTNHPESLHAVSNTAFDATDTSDASQLRLMMQLSQWQRLAINTVGGHSEVSGIGPDQGPPVVDGIVRCPDNDPGGEFHQPCWTRGESVVAANHRAVCVVTQEGAPAKMLVGAIELADSPSSRYLVWRRTARVVSPLVTIYSGPYDDPGYNQHGANLGSAGRIISSVVPGSVSGPPPVPVGPYPEPRWTWTTGGLCGAEWPFFMQPRWVQVAYGIN